MMRLLVISFCCLWIPFLSQGAITDTLKRIEEVKPINIKINGKVAELNTGAMIPNTLIIQKGIGGTFVKGDGTFTITIKKTDTLLVSSLGYRVRTFCFKDSSGTSFNVSVELSKLDRELAAAYVMPKRKLNEIHKDLEQLRLELPGRPTGIDALQSPITAIYETFSKLAKSKRDVISMEHNDYKNDLLKELFKLYVDGDVINLSPDEFENFIYFCNVSDGFLRTASEYQLITFFQSRYKEYVALKQ